MNDNTADLIVKAMVITGITVSILFMSRCASSMHAASEATAVEAIKHGAVKAEQGSWVKP